MDKWILAATHELIKFVMEEMAAYRLYTVVPRLVKLIDDLTNWYVRLNRRRLKGEAGVKSCLASLQTLYEVVQLLTRMMSPFTPFLTEYMFQNLRRALPPTDDDTRSVHFMPFPKPTQAYFDHDIVRYVKDDGAIYVAMLICFVAHMTVCVAMWYVAMRLCGYVAMWLCGNVAMLLCG